MKKNKTKTDWKWNGGEEKRARVSTGPLLDTDWQRQAARPLTSYKAYTFFYLARQVEFFLQPKAPLLAISEYSLLLLLSLSLSPSFSHFPFVFFDIEARGAGNASGADPAEWNLLLH